MLWRSCQACRCCSARATLLAGARGARSRPLHCAAAPPWEAWPDASQQQPALSELAARHGVCCVPELAAGSHGVGLFMPAAAGGCAEAAPTRGQGADAPADAGWSSAIVSVPLPLVLSCCVPGCSPEAGADARLQQYLGLGGSWPVQLGAMLLWAAGGLGSAPPAGRLHNFWASYARFIPPAARQSSLLLWSDEQLRELQDPELAAAAQQWRAEVRGAHEALLSCWGTAGGASGSGGGRGRAGEDGPGGGWLSWPAFSWAVASVESRAFGIKQGGREAQALVPWLDLANHAARSPCSHGLSADGAAFELRCAPGSFPPGAEVLICYGEQGSRSLMEQYGFVPTGGSNPFDRVDFDLEHLPANARVRRDAVRAASQRCQALPAAAGPAAAGRLECAAACVLRAAGWRSLAEYRDLVTPAGTVAVADALLAQVHRQLAAFPTTPEQDAQLLLAGGGGGSSGGGQVSAMEEGDDGASGLRLHAALQYRLERKALLEATRDLLGALRASPSAAAA